MTEKRVNPDTGVLEEKRWHGWTASENAEGREERFNPKTGVHEEKRWHGWTSSENSAGREERINSDTGVYEEKRWHGWTSSENSEGREERTNSNTGVHEEKRWYGWSPTENSEGRPERIDRETGRYEEKRWYGWTPKEGAGHGPGHAKTKSSVSRNGQFSESNGSAREARESTSYSARNSSSSGNSYLSDSSASSSEGGAFLAVFLLAGVVFLFFALVAGVQFNRQNGSAAVPQPASELTPPKPIVESANKQQPQANNPYCGELAKRAWYFAEFCRNSELAALNKKVGDLDSIFFMTGSSQPINSLLWQTEIDKNCHEASSPPDCLHSALVNRSLFLRAKISEALASDKHGVFIDEARALWMQEQHDDQAGTALNNQSPQEPNRERIQFDPVSNSLTIPAPPPNYVPSAAEDQPSGAVPQQFAVTITNQGCQSADYYIDNQIVATIEPGAYRLLSVIAGAHVTRSCVANSLACGPDNQVTIDVQTNFTITRHPNCPP